MSNELQVIETTLSEIQPNFISIAKEHGEVNWETEIAFAMQCLENNDYLRKIATSNQNSLRNAVINIATVGLSLNPALKYAYLVPRDGRVCLDFSYIGLVHLACDAGSLRWVQADIVRKNDVFESKGVGTKPVHDYDVFGERGEIVGAYCVAKTVDNEYLTTVMNIADIYAIRDRSTAWQKSKKGPWLTDPEEMIKKTVIKRAFKLWPKNDKRLDMAIQAVNEHEGIDFDDEIVVEMISKHQLKEINRLLGEINREEAQFLVYLSTKYKKNLTSLDSLTKEEAVASIKDLNNFLSAKKQRESEAKNE